MYSLYTLIAALRPSPHLTVLSIILHSCESRELQSLPEWREMHTCATAAQMLRFPPVFLHAVQQSKLKAVYSHTSKELRMVLQVMPEDLLTPLPD